MDKIDNGVTLILHFRLSVRKTVTILDRYYRKCSEL